MKIFIILVISLMLGSGVFAQKTFELRNASKYFDITISAEGCSETECNGRAVISFFKKGASAPYQVIKQDETYIVLDWGGGKIGEKLTYEKQSTIEIGDFNFDGMEDIAISNGRYGNYAAQSFEVYLSSRSTGKFVRNEEFSRLGQEYTGLFHIDKKKKTFKVFAKNGCCWHVEEEYKVVNGQPVKIYVKEQDATIPDEMKVKITTKTLVKGKWQTKVEFTER